MAYGELTIERKGYDDSGTWWISFGDLNVEYSLCVNLLIGVLPSSERSYLPTGGNAGSGPGDPTADWLYVEDFMVLRETDYVALQVKTLADCKWAAVALMRRWLTLANALGMIYSFDRSNVVFDGDAWEEGLQDFTWFGYSEDGGTDGGGTTGGYVPTPKQKDEDFGGAEKETRNDSDDPREISDDDDGTIGEVIALSNTQSGRRQIPGLMNRFLIKERLDFEHNFNSGLYEPFPVSTQNIYYNSYMSAERTHQNTAETQSILVDSVRGVAGYVAQKNQRYSSTQNNTLSREIVATIGSAYTSTSSISQILEKAQGIEVPAVLRSNVDRNYEAPRNMKPLSNSSGFQEMQGPGNNGRVKVSPILKQQVSSTNGKLTQLSQFGGGTSGVIVREIIPVSSNSTVGNNTTAFKSTQVVANVANFINGMGELRSVQPTKDSSFSYTGSIKLYNTTTSNLFPVLSAIGFPNVGFTATSGKIYTSQNALSGFQKEGSLGVESFEDTGYNSWNPGARSPLFVMSFGEDVGYDGWDKGEGFSSGSVETFDDGWAAGFSPYSRQGESVEFVDDLTSQVSGSSKVFVTTYPYIRGTLRVSWNGQEQIVGSTFLETNEKSFTLTFTPGSGDYLSATYSRFYGTQDPGDFGKTPQEQLASFLADKARDV